MPSAALQHRVENDNILVLERVFNAPRELVFDMYTKAEHLKHWWGPRGWDTPFCEVDLKVGGAFKYCMKCVDKAQGDFFGMESWGKSVYTEIRRPEFLAYTDYFCHPTGEVNPDLPTTDATVEFVAEGGKTKVVSRSIYASAENLKTVMDMGMLEGISQTWDRLEERLAAVQQG